MLKKSVNNKKRLNKKIQTVVEKYLHAIADSGLPIQAAYVFGSQVSGRSNPESDIDIGIISINFRHQWWVTQMKLRALRRPIDLRIEPHGFAPEDFIPEHPLFLEIKRHGIKMQ